MNCCILNGSTGRLQSFKERSQLLTNALIFNSREELLKKVTTIEDAAFFFLELDNESKTKNLAQVIKSFSQENKIFIVFKPEFSSEVKKLQLDWSFVDAFLEEDIGKVSLDYILNSFQDVQVASELEQVFEGIEDVKKMAKNPISLAMNEIFKQNFNIKEEDSLPNLPTIEANEYVETQNGEDMSDKDQELALDDLGELEIADTNSLSDNFSSHEETGLELSLDQGVELEASEQNYNGEIDGNDNPALNEISLGNEESEELSLGDEESEEFSLGDEVGEELSLGDDFSAEESSSLELGDSEFLNSGDQISDLEFNLDSQLNEVSVSEDNSSELSEDAKKKLEEIDQILSEDSSKVNINNFSLEESQNEGVDIDLNQDFSLNLDSETDAPSEDLPVLPESPFEELEISSPMVEDEGISFQLEGERESSSIVEEDSENVEDILLVNSIEEQDVSTQEVIPREELSQSDSEEKEEIKKIRSNDNKNSLATNLAEISGAYSVELDRLQATIANLRIDREDLLKKIEDLEEEKMLSHRNSLNMRAELDEKKIELVIIRKKLNEEISLLKDKLKIFEEKNLILEEKNKNLTAEVEKSNQKNKIDFKKVQMRERELEQKLELLKNDTEVQIKNRDLKILELKRKIDSMEFDIETINEQEKKSIETRVDLEERLEKAVKTLKMALSLIEEDAQNNRTIDILKKNIDI